LQFEKEVTILLRIPVHPHVISFKGVAKLISPVLGDQYCLVLEYCEGGSLLAYLKSNQKMSKKQPIQWIFEICQGLSHLHKHNVIHRDIAARNILLSKDHICKISDFGMARAMNKEVSMATTGNALGPLKWNAPESIQFQQYSSKSDSWMLGVLIIEIITRTEPWPGKTTTEVGSEVVNKKIHHPIPKEATPEIKAVLESLFQFDPKQRAEADEIANTMQQLLKK